MPNPTPAPLPWRPSLATTLVVTVALLSVLAGLVGGWQALRWAEDDRAAREQRLLSRTVYGIRREIAIAMDERARNVYEARALLENELASAPTEQRRAVMNRILDANPNFSWLGEVDLTGRIRTASRHLLEGASVTGRDWFEGGVTRDAYVGDLHPAKLLEKHIHNEDGSALRLLDIALPLRDGNGQVVGVLGSHLNWRMVTRAVQDMLSGPEGQGLAAALVAEDGEILYDSEGLKGPAGAGLPTQAHQMQAVHWPAPAGEVLALMAPLDADGAGRALKWRVVVRSSVAAWQADLGQLRWRIASLSGALALCLSLLGLLAMRGLARPLRQLVSDIRRFGATGELPPDGRQDRFTEMRVLHASFRQMALDVARQQDALKESQAEVVRALGRAAEFRDNETGNHVLRMSQCSAHLGQLAGLPPDQVDMLRLASQLHDVGKIGIPDHILLKPGRFSPEERVTMEAHVVIGAQILTGLETPLTVMARQIALAHHERWDGQGYPLRLAGEAIPLLGRIVAICDVFDALLSERPYKTAWTLDATREHLEREAGRHFDPSLVALFLAHLDAFVQIRARHLDAQDA